MLHKLNMKSKQTNIDKILKDIKANNRRIKQGMPLKFIVAGYTPKRKSKALKALDTFMYLIACASISLMLVILLIQWMSI